MLPQTKRDLVLQNKRSRAGKQSAPGANKRTPRGKRTGRREDKRSRAKPATAETSHEPVEHQTPKPSYWQPSRKEVARLGEQIAASFLVKQGYEIIDENWRSGKFGEIDLVVQNHSGLLCFIEVKTRKIAPDFGMIDSDDTKADALNLGCEAINWRKKRKILIAARSYISQTRLNDAECRIDVIVVGYKKAITTDNGDTLSDVAILHIPGAFSEI